MTARFFWSGTGAIFTALVCSAIGSAVAEGPAKHGPYTGQQDRAIKSLSKDDVRDLQRGAGWGLAKAAELNSLPGPLHVLELADDIEVTPDQRQKIERVFADMRRAAPTLGVQVSGAARRLNGFFQSGGWMEKDAAETLTRLVKDAARARGALRLVHLNAHLKMPPILSAEQIARYNRRRGYGKADPCSAVPKGHDPVMWRRHNGCK